MTLEVEGGNLSEPHFWELSKDVKWRGTYFRSGEAASYLGSTEKGMASCLQGSRHKHELSCSLLMHCRRVSMECELSWPFQLDHCL
eukprot:3289321-Rhodomonas_salina.2